MEANLKNIKPQIRVKSSLAVRNGKETHGRDVEIKTKLASFVKDEFSRGNCFKGIRGRDIIQCL